MRYKTSKLRNLEKNRFSIITQDLEHCFLCGREPVDMHEIYGGANRRTSMINGFCIPLCRRCHQFVTVNTCANQNLKKTCQQMYELQGHTREDFIKVIGKNFLEQEDDNH